MKVFARTALPTLNHVVDSFKVFIFNQDELVNLYNDIKYSLVIYRNECQRLSAKKLARLKTTITAGQAKWQGLDQRELVVESQRAVDPVENLAALAKLTENDTSTLNLTVELTEDAKQKVEVKRTVTQRRKELDNLPPSVKSWQEVIDHLKTDNETDDTLMPPVAEIATNIDKLQDINTQHYKELNEHYAKINKFMFDIKRLNTEIASLRQQVDNGKDQKTAAQAAAELQVKREVLRQCSPTLEMLTNLREDLKYFQNAAYYSKQQLESCKLELKIALLCHLKTEVLKLAEQCQLRGLHENATSKKIVSSAKLPMQ